MNNLEKFKELYKEIYNEINNSLNNYNEKLIDDIDIVNKNKIAFANLNSGGKLVRGFLIGLGYKLIKNDYKYSIPLSTAFEIFQTSILVHDDIIDNDYLRRGKTTIHKYNLDSYDNLVKCNKEEKVNTANSLALCMGDLGLFEASNLISKSYKNDKNLANILCYFNDIVIKTIRGEMLDVYLPFAEKNKIRTSNLENDIFKIYELKTAWYTLIGPITLGMVLANAESEKINDIKEFAYPIGIAFQIQDDILGIYSTNQKLGKIVGSDIKEFKQTILYSHVINTEYKDEFLKYYGNNELTDKQIERVSKILIDSGSLDYAKNKMNELYNEAKNKLKNIMWINQEDKDILYGLIDYLDKREK